MSISMQLMPTVCVCVHNHYIVFFLYTERDVHLVASENTVENNTHSPDNQDVGIINDEVEANEGIDDLELNKCVFRRLVRQLADNLDMRDLKFEPEAIRLMQYISEDFLMMLFHMADAQRHTQSMYVCVMVTWFLIRALVTTRM